MNRDEADKRDWLDEVWRIKEELSAVAKRMGVREYLAFAEKEAGRILEARSRPATFLAREKPTGSDHGN